MNWICRRADWWEEGLRPAPPQTGIACTCTLARRILLLHRSARAAAAARLTICHLCSIVQGKAKWRTLQVDRYRTGLIRQRMSSMRRLLGRSQEASVYHWLRSLFIWEKDSSAPPLLSNSWQDSERSQYQLLSRALLQSLILVPALLFPFTFAALVLLFLSSTLFY